MKRFLSFITNQDFLIPSIIVLSVVSFLLTIALFLTSESRVASKEAVVRQVIEGVRFEYADSDFSIISYILPSTAPFYQELYKRAWEDIFHIRHQPVPPLPTSAEQYKVVREQEINNVNDLLSGGELLIGSLSKTEFRIFVAITFMQFLNVIFAALLAFATRKESREYRAEIALLKQKVAEHGK